MAPATLPRPTAPRRSAPAARGFRPALAVLGVLAALVLAGCGLLPDDAGQEAEGPAGVADPAATAETAMDSATIAGAAADTTAGDTTAADTTAGDTAAAGTAASDTTAAETAGTAPAAAPATQPASGLPTSQAAAPQDSLLAALLQQVLIGQAAINQRIDSLSGEMEPDSLEGGRVLGEAQRQVRGFGIRLAWSILVLVIINLTVRGTVWLLDTLAERNPSRRLFFKRLVPVVRIVLWAFAAYFIVRFIFDVDAQGFLAAAAAVGVAVGFAAQELLKNLFGGIILVFDQPFQVGDKIEVGDTYGEVISIGLRSTRIRTGDDNLVSVPNAQVVDQQVSNANAGQLNCQVVTDLYLPGWADEEAAKRIAFEAAASSKYVYLNKPIVVLVSDVFKETFLTRVRVKAYVLDPRLELLFRSDVTERARAGFREAGLLLPRHMLQGLVERSGVGGGDGDAAEGDDGPEDVTGEREKVVDDRQDEVVDDRQDEVVDERA